MAIVRPHAGSSWHVDWSPDGHVIASAAQSDGIGLTDDRPLAARLAAQRAAVERMVAARRWVERELDVSRRSPSELSDALRQDPALSPEEREARLAALTSALAGIRDQVLGYL
ncbi:MAG: hypothetical protein L6Q99_02530 [Planctomycetes bacterium]|nr:hypothetical protein [Planctomycetota bacterium]